jgi:hypothetical protein
MTGEAHEARDDPARGDESALADHAEAALNDPRAVDILTTEHWSLLSTRTLGYQEMFGRATIFIGILSATIVALAFLAQATDFGRGSLLLALLLFAVALFIGIVTFIRCVEINFEDARWVAGMDLLRRAYVTILPGLEPHFITMRESDADRRTLGHGSPQRLANLAKSLTTTSGVVAALNSMLAGALAGDVSALVGGSLYVNAAAAGALSIISAVLHVLYAGNFRRTHEPSERSPN